ncbi:regucalcin-like [Belonocnema kinseyi]|uniref:regucalcin-like n=1 Tax=Belonocnema kinseyi TaxID=2817044 RepID=UPI00143DBF42|nr:regucalcin-like [Belonocnema kinseyi]
MKIFGIYIFSFVYLLTTFRNSIGATYENGSSVQIKRLVEKSGLTEGPHWDPITQKLFFVDIWANKICSYNPQDTKVYCAYIANGPVGVVVPVEDTPNTFVVGSGVDILLVTWDGECDTNSPPIRKIATAEKFRPETRFNDGKADSSGRFWAGTITEINGEPQPNEAAFYSLDKDLVLRTQIKPVTISNGLAWNSDDDTLYYIDTPTRQIAAFDYNKFDGTISNKRIVFDVVQNNLPGVPDGMTIDSDGNLWIALFGGSQVIQVDPKSGKLLRSIPMPAKRITSVTFGDFSLDTLYVTTAGYGFARPQEKTPADDLQGGSIFSIKGTGARGFSPNLFRI